MIADTTPSLQKGQPRAPEPIPALPQKPTTNALRKPTARAPVPSPGATPTASPSSPAPTTMATGAQPILIDQGATGAAPAPTAVPAAVPAATPTPAPTAVPSATPATQPPLQPTTLTPTNPENPLTAQTISAGPGLDRFQVANAQYDQFVKGTNPAYQAALRDATRRGAAMGGIGSGMLRSSFGDLGRERTDAIGGERSKLFIDALLGSVDDARFATGVTQQQQGFQQGQQQQAFGNEATRLQMQEALRNGDFERAMALWQAGQAGGTGSGTAMAGANAAGNQAKDANAALQAWMAQLGNQGASAPPSDFPRGTTYGGGLTLPPGSA